jgi:hypothetical protein
VLRAKHSNADADVESVGAKVNPIAAAMMNRFIIRSFSIGLIAGQSHPFLLGQR